MASMTMYFLFDATTTLNDCHDFIQHYDAAGYRKATIIDIQLLKITNGGFALFIDLKATLLYSRQP